MQAHHLARQLLCIALHACPAPTPCRSSLHRALYQGHMQCCALLLQAGASFEVADAQVAGWVCMWAGTHKG